MKDCKPIDNQKENDCQPDNKNTVENNSDNIPLTSGYMVHSTSENNLPYKELKSYECTGYTCRHQTSERHYTVNEDFILSLLRKQKASLKQRIEALFSEEIPVEIPYDEEEKDLIAKIGFSPDTPEYLKERRYGMEIQRKRMLSALNEIDV